MISIMVFELALLAFQLAAPPLCNGADTQHWNEFIFAFDLHEGASMEVGLEQQFTDQRSKFTLYNITLEPSFRLSSTRSAGFGYRHEREKEDGIWTTEDRYWLHYVTKHRVGAWTFKFRPLLEYRNLAEHDDWLIRPKLFVQHPVRIGNARMKATVVGDPYYYFDTGTVRQKRISAGLTFDLDKKTECSVYYLRKLKLSDDDWKTTHVIGTEIVFSY